MVGKGLEEAYVGGIWVGTSVEAVVDAVVDRKVGEFVKSGNSVCAFIVGKLTGGVVNSYQFPVGAFVSALRVGAEAGQGFLYRYAPGPS